MMVMVDSKGNAALIYFADGQLLSLLYIYCLINNI